MENDDTDDKNLIKKKNILQSLVDIEKNNVKKDRTIEFLISKRVESLEEKWRLVQESENNDVKMVQCEYCDFYVKNQRGLQLHMNAKHVITKVNNQL